MEFIKVPLSCGKHAVYIKGKPKGCAHKGAKHLVDFIDGLDKDEFPCKDYVYICDECGAEVREECREDSVKRNI